MTTGRTFAVGDAGDLDGLERIFAALPPLEAADTIVFVGDSVDRGPSSARLVDFVRTLLRRAPARVVALRGNHEDGSVRRRAAHEVFAQPLDERTTETHGPRVREDDRPCRPNFAATRNGC